MTQMPGAGVAVAVDAGDLFGGGMYVQSGGDMDMPPSFARRSMPTMPIGAPSQHPMAASQSAPAPRPDMGDTYVNASGQHGR
jgi:hypothetical protein